MLSAAELQRTIERLAQAIIEPNGASEDLILIGIRKGGENFARRIHAQIKTHTGVTLPLTPMSPRGVIRVTLPPGRSTARINTDLRVSSRDIE